jgi:hypothetical protein
VTERSAGQRNGARRRIGIALAVVVGLFATAFAAFALNLAADALEAGTYADCPPEEWSRALLDESRVIAGVPSDSAGDYGDCDASGTTDLIVQEHPDAGTCATIVDRAVARGWTVVQQTAPCEVVMSRDLDSRTATLTLTSDADVTSGSVNLLGQWHREP